MNKTHYASLLIHECVRERATVQQSADNEEYRDWANAGTATLACRYTQHQERYAQEDRSFEVLTETTLFLESDADITVYDRVTNVRVKATGQLVDAGPFDVLDITPKFGMGFHHIEARLEKVA